MEVGNRSNLDTKTFEYHEVLNFSLFFLNIQKQEWLTLSSDHVARLDFSGQLDMGNVMHNMTRVSAKGIVQVRVPYSKTPGIFDHCPILNCLGLVRYDTSSKPIHFYHWAIILHRYRVPYSTTADIFDHCPILNCLGLVRYDTSSKPIHFYYWSIILHRYRVPYSKTPGIFDHCPILNCLGLVRYDTSSKPIHFYHWAIILHIEYFLCKISRSRLLFRPSTIQFC
jgi:hypothetical protein